MNVKVTEKAVAITGNSLINEGDYQVNECSFSLPESFKELEITAVFNGIPVPLGADCRCFVPSLKKGNAVLGVYAYKKNGEEMQLVYSPKPAVFWVGEGSFTDNFTEEAVADVSKYEEYCRMLLEKSGDKSLYSNALKGVATGEIVRLDNVSSIEHGLNVELGSEGDITDFSNVRLHVSGKNHVGSDNIKIGMWKADGTLVPGYVNYRAFEVFLPAGMYTFSVNEGQTQFSLSNYILDGKFVSLNSVAINKYSFRLKNAQTLKFCFRKINSLNFEESDMFQLEYGGDITSFEPMKHSVYCSNSSGKITGVKSYFPNMFLFCEQTEISVSVEYSRDINKAFSAIEEKLLQLTEG